MSGGDPGRLGATRAIGLSAASLVWMIGLVLALNVGSYGAVGLIGGLALILGSSILGVRLFRGH